MRIAQPIVSGETVDGNEQVVPLRQAWQHTVTAPKIGAIGVFLVHTGGMVDEDHCARPQGRLPKMFATARFAGVVILGGSEHIVRRLVGNLVDLSLPTTFWLATDPWAVAPSRHVAFARPERGGLIQGDPFMDRRAAIFL